jgi:methionyl-tRNA synthetase
MKPLMDAERLLHGKPSIKLNIESNNKRGTIRLCSLYGCYDHECDINLTEQEVARFYCPHCNQQLISKDKCDDCDAPMVPMLLEIGGKVFFCSRKGCKKHFVAFEDIDLELRKFYNEYGS